MPSVRVYKSRFKQEVRRREIIAGSLRGYSGTRYIFDVAVNSRGVRNLARSIDTAICIRDTAV